MSRPNARARANRYAWLLLPAMWLALPAWAAEGGEPATVEAREALALAKAEEGENEAAIALFEQVVAYYEKAPDGGGQPLIDALTNLGNLLQREHAYDRAIPVLRRALALREERHGPDTLDTAKGQAALAVTLRWAGQYPESEKLTTSALALRERLAGKDSPEAIESVEEMAILFYRQGRHDQALALMQRAMAANSVRHGAESPEVAQNLHNIGSLLDDQGKYAEADAALQQALVIREKTRGPDDISVAATLNNLGMRYYTQGRFDEAERAWQRSLAIVEKNVGREHPYVAALLTNLAGLQNDRGQVEAAIPLYQRAMAIEEKTLGADHPDYAITVNNLGLAYLELGRVEEAEQMLRRAVAIQEKALGPDHPDVANSLNNLAGALIDGDRAEEALPLLDRALAIEAKALREDHPKYAASLRTRAGLLSRMGRHEEAQADLEQALAILRKSLGEQSLEVVVTLQAQAEARATAGDMLAALEPTRAATRILAERFATTSGGAGEAAASEQVAQQSAFLRHVNVLTLVPDSEVEREPRARESFELGQWARASTVGASVAQMAARFASGDDALATAVRQRQDRIESLRGIEVELFNALGKMPAERDGEAEAALRMQRDTLRTQLAESDALLAERFPDYLAMTSPRPLPAAEVQTLLRPGEALLAYLVTKRKTFAWVVTRDTVVFRALEIGREELDGQVQFLRSRLQPDERGQLPALTPATSARLYQSVMAPLAPALGDARRIFVVADGALQSLPLGVLGADGEWLAKRHAFALLPSVSALRALRTFHRGRPGSEPFAGFGDPVLDGRPGDNRGLGLGVVFSTRSTAGLADVAALRQAPPLPETADELRAIANALRAPPASVHLREQATEAAVKSADLSRYRVLAFATHGITAGELVGAAEPGLVLTPPATATAEDDGYLSASEVAQLELNADWVLLSACNTAAPDGKPGAEGLSGLAKAFLHAGSRALLVSNWPVASLSTQALITDTVRRYADQPNQGKPEALQAAMLDMLSRPDTAHPFHWAPFSMVGE